MSDLVIETKKLTKIYGEQTAVNSVNLHVKPGRIYGLLGRHHLVKVFCCFFRNGLLVGSLAGRWSGLLAGTKRKNKQNTE